MKLHLLIPDFFLPAHAGTEAYRRLSLPALEMLLARGERRAGPGSSLERWLAGAFGIAPQYDDVPLAPYAVAGEGLDPGDSAWVRADPVHFAVHRDRVGMIDGANLDIGRGEADALVDALNGHFAQVGVRFVAPHPLRWYARLARPPRIRTTPLSEVAGRDIDRCLPEGEDGAAWRRLVNEAQMLLHADPCNAAREARGAMTVNGVWLSGAGTMPEAAPRPFCDVVWTDNVLARGLATAAGTAAAPLPASGHELTGGLQAGPARETGLVILESLRGLRLREMGEWLDAIAAIEAQWIAPLLSPSASGPIRALVLHALGPDRSLSAAWTRRDRLKIWHARRPIAEYVR